MDAVLAEVVKAREDLGVCIVFMTDCTGDLFLQVLEIFLHHSCLKCHGLYSGIRVANLEICG